MFIQTKGEEIRDLKKSKPEKATLQPHIDALVALKTQYKDETGKPYVAPGATANASGGGGGATKQAKKVFMRFLDMSGKSNMAVCPYI